METGVRAQPVVVIVVYGNWCTGTTFGGHRSIWKWALLAPLIFAIMRLTIWINYKSSESLHAEPDHETNVNGAVYLSQNRLYMESYNGTKFLVLNFLFIFALPSIFYRRNSS